MKTKKAFGAEGTDPGSKGTDPSNKNQSDSPDLLEADFETSNSPDNLPVNPHANLPANPPARPAVALKEVYKLFPVEGQKGKFNCALENISLSIKKGSITVIGGANGSGKSVLMNIISSLMPPSSGSVVTAGKPGLVFQDAAVQILGDTPREDVAVGPGNLGVPKKEIGRIVEAALESVSLLEKADFPAEFLSGGEKRRLAVASILAMNRDIIIFDEPYANLDFPGVVEVNSLIQKLHLEGKTVLLLTHELEKCLALADHFVVLYKGKKVFDGNPEEGLKQKLEQWGIRNPLNAYLKLEDLVWDNTAFCRENSNRGDRPLNLQKSQTEAEEKGTLENRL